MEKIILERQRMGIKQSGNNGKANGKKDGKKKSKGQPGGKTVVDNPSVPSVAKDDKRHGAKKQKKKKRANKSASAAEPTSSSGANITKQKESSKSKSDGASDRQVNNGNGETVTKAMGRRIRRKRDQQEYVFSDFRSNGSVFWSNRSNSNSDFQKEPLTYPGV